MTKTLKLSLPAFLAVTCIVASCTQPQNGTMENQNQDTTEKAATQSNTMQNSMDVNKAVAVINSNSTDASGWVTFTKMNDGIQVHAELSGLSDGKHGFHIHMYGDCRADYSSAGGHFNPANEQHGAPTDSVRHMGDMGNITASGGSATLNYTDSVIQLNKIIGRAVIVHEGSDDLSSQPSGAAGSRIACGVIGIANPDFMTNGTNNNM